MFQKAALVCVIALSLVACGKKDEGGNSVTSTTGAATATPAAAAPDCEKVVEKIASLNPPDSRGEPEKKLWRSMCAAMTAAEKTCTVGAKSMEDMKGCMKR